MTKRLLLLGGIAASLIGTGAFHLLSAQPSLSILDDQEPQETSHQTRADGAELIKIYVIECSLEDAIASVERYTGKKAHKLKSSVLVELNKRTTVRIEQTRMPKLVRITVAEISAYTPIQEFKRTFGLR
jgi:hypothetical protein